MFIAKSDAKVAKKGEFMELKELKGVKGQ